MISYNNLWITMKQRGISQYSLIHTHHISAGQLSRLRKNSYVSTHTVDTLCSILDCRVEDIMTYIRESSEPKDEVLNSDSVPPLNVSKGRDTVQIRFSNTPSAISLRPLIFIIFMNLSLPLLDY